MYDLQQIIAQNNEAAIDAMMTGMKVEKAQSPLPENWALSFLAGKLKVGPPLLSEVIKGFVDIEDLELFLRLIRLFVPEHETEILGSDRQQRVYRFCYLFGERYFPLPRGVAQYSIHDLVHDLPVELMSMSYSAYHNMDMRRGYLLLLSLVEYPYEGDDRDTFDDDVPFDPFNPMVRFALEQGVVGVANAKKKEPKWRPRKSDIIWVKNVMKTLADGGRWVAPMGFTFIKIDDRNIELRQADNSPEVRETVRRTVICAEQAGLKVKVKVGKTAEEKKLSGARVALLDAVRRLVGDHLTGLIPEEGWSPADLHKMTDGTAFDGVGHFADWACQETGCVVLDNNYDMVDFVDEEMQPYFRWTEHNVQLLAGDWPKVKEYRQKIDRIVEWLETDYIQNFGALVRFLATEAKQKVKVKPKKKGRYSIMKRERFFDVTEHTCPLDQIYDEEEEEDYGENRHETIIQAGGQVLREATAEDIEAAVQF